MKIQIKKVDGLITSIKVDGVELNGIVSEFTISQKGGELPMLVLNIPLREGMDIELPFDKTTT